MIVTTRGWSGAQIVWTHASGAATYSVDGNTLNAYAVATALRAWLEDAARPWAAAIDVVTLTVEPDADDERLRFVFGFTGSTPTFVSVAPTAAWIAQFGDTSASPPTGCRGSTAGLVASTLWERVAAAPSGRSRNGSWRMEPANASLRRPIVRFVGTPAQSEALSVAIRAASQPRQAYIRDEARDSWRLVTLGEYGPMEHPDGDVSLVVGPIQAYGAIVEA